MTLLDDVNEMKRLVYKNSPDRTKEERRYIDLTAGLSQETFDYILSRFWIYRLYGNPHARMYIVGNRVMVAAPREKKSGG